MRALKAVVLAPIPAVILQVCVSFIHPMMSPLLVVSFVPLPLASSLGYLSAVVVIWLFYAYAIIGLLALPLYRFLRSKNIENARVTIIIGALLAFLIEFIQLVLLFLFFFGVSESESWDAAWSEYLDSVLTARNIIWMSKTMALSALWGAICGATFWQVYKNPHRYKLRWVIAALIVVAAVPVAVMMVVGPPWR